MTLKGNDKNSIMISKFPVVNEEWKNDTAEKEMEMMMEMITSIRNIRGEMRIAPSQKLSVLISAADEQTKKMIETDKGYIVNLANLESLKVEINAIEPKGVATAVIGSTKIFVPLAGIVDISGEKTRLEKELAKISKDLEQSSKKLANRDFIAKAAPEIIQERRRKIKRFPEKVFNSGRRAEEIKRDFRLMKKEILKIIKNALSEDIGAGDITTKATVSRTKKGKALAIAKDDFIIAGIDVFEETFKFLDKKIKVKKLIKDGCMAKKGDVIAEVSGSLSSILMAERVSLNLFQRMCGIATLTAKYVKAVGGTKAKILDTRKTVPGLRVLDKMAVRIGGGCNHRIGLYDGVLIKDNHIEAAGGITAAVKAQRKSIGRKMKIEVETKNINEVKEALACGVDIIMLDNMSIPAMKQAVDFVAGRALLEASGNVSLKNVADIAAIGVDFISVGELTHSVRAADISLKIKASY